MSEIIDNYSFDTAEKQATARQFFAKVYGFMFFALIVSGAIAYQYGTVEFIAKYFLTVSADGQAKIAPLFYVVVFSPIAVALLFQTMINRLSFPLLFGLFSLYSILIGFSLSTIFIVYSMTSIAITFGVTAGTFGVMAIMGYVTKVDLTKFGSILMMAFWGIFIAGIVNFFLHSDSLGYIISMIGVVVFTGLTAYHMQQLKKFAHDSEISADQKNKLALLGGFTLYILFVNLFLSLLRLFGSRD
ncbi:Bax inhibitor-1/YccA family protein [Fluviicola sp.]|jgi:FtsH-binding integral membrane protein|uniref:Bax inhibitor-1/YccA family protein n=1 Tax=Fluviicola sp. TaxID=1917219 RepID=UPI002837BFF0|nr:Bax inhibitor-1/YccA family protein [Fluviicola sp.]MDR0801306.1 Bax inhibitor-1/YccA family protein [Fluviicola sp.]